MYAKVGKGRPACMENDGLLLFVSGFSIGQPLALSRNFNCDSVTLFSLHLV